MKNDLQNNQTKDNFIDSPSMKLKSLWLTFLCSLLYPHVILFMLLSGILLYFIYAVDMDKRLSIFLQILATLMSGLGVTFIFDAFKNASENNILVKKGLSAVRNLSLTRLKAKNISNRVKANAGVLEISNLISLLEKDISNAIQEWNDISPDVGRGEAIYELLAEKENELEIAGAEIEQLARRLKEEKELSDKEKEELKISHNEMVKKFSELSREVNTLRPTVNSLTLASAEITNRIARALSDANRCSNCGKPYQSTTIGIGLCENCQKPNPLDLLLHPKKQGK